MLTNDGDTFEESTNQQIINKINSIILNEFEILTNHSYTFEESTLPTNH